ncbi:hypothetical protein [Nonomuraea lactucae]|uniref:hypothetical protein n=1 Tax=Nonomuraea lactucae TaxID=2249762 RepID=UPI0013B378F4|nr:hypothetical protein [Nonomuraea lactucae]
MRPLGTALAAILLATSCAPAGGQAATQVTPTVPAASDRPDPGGGVTRTCGSHYAHDFDPGLESRTVQAGPVSLLAFRVSPVPDRSAPVRTFKMMVRLSAGAQATIRTATAGTSLAYDRARFREDNTYRLGDGENSVRFVGCRDRSAVFNGAILTTGPRTVELDVVVGGSARHVAVTAYASTD